MVKKKIEEIPTLKEGIEDLKEEDSTEVETETNEPGEESKLQIVTNEQLTQYKLDNLSLQNQEMITQFQKLIEVLRKRK